jgi:hypothetical protein
VSAARRIDYHDDPSAQHGLWPGTQELPSRRANGLRRGRYPQPPQDPPSPPAVDLLVHSVAVGVVAGEAAELVAGGLGALRVVGGGLRRGGLRAGGMSSSRARGVAGQ